MIAAEYGYANIVKTLLEKGANVNEKGWYDMTPLHFAAYNGHEKTIESSIQAGANVNAVFWIMLTNILKSVLKVMLRVKT
ncbi:ankyrin repeat family protein [Wolbachia endosymbiont of Trichogramma pretiosum]|nr:ankyrin repeat family protein [Wolbachia endosymbiont of Trichogramma pretiosum]